VRVGVIANAANIAAARAAVCAIVSIRIPLANDLADLRQTLRAEITIVGIAGFSE
jgi:hypothetical protein